MCFSALALRRVYRAHVSRVVGLGVGSRVDVRLVCGHNLSRCGWVAGCLGWQALRMRAMLTWDGQVWCLHDQTTGDEDALGVVYVALDVQTALLLRWQPASDALNAKSQWLWLGAQSTGDAWQNLRRAVYQRVDL